MRSSIHKTSLKVFKENFKYPLELINPNIKFKGFI